MRLLIFLIVSIGIVIFSWPYLRNPRAHGFFRFFAFETILLLVLTNSRAWFQNPFTVSQVISWILLFGSLLLAVHGFYLLRLVGKPEGGWENTTRLVKRGAYRTIRHPLYCSLLVFGAGALMKDISLVSLSLFIALIAFLIATARIEEAENIRNFGLEYEEYMKTTRMFIPYIL